MPRKPRHQQPDAYYHVVSRGNNKQTIFDENLRELFLKRLFHTSRRHEWDVLAFALMRNHYHLVIHIGDKGLSNGMFELNNAFARASNMYFGRINHCFGQRFWSAHLNTPHYLLNSIRYGMWNPVRAGRCATPADSGWTSYRSSVGLDAPHPVVAVGPLLELFDANPVRARRALSAFVLDGHGPCQAPWDGPSSA